MPNVLGYLAGVSVPPTYLLCASPQTSNTLPSQVGGWMDMVAACRRFGQHVCDSIPHFIALLQSTL